MKRIEDLSISPTPWRVLEWSGLTSQYTVESETHTVCDLDNDDSVRADARLIAAAPELYRALRLAWTYADKLRCEWPMPQLVRDTMRAALEKAGGAE